MNTLTEIPLTESTYFILLSLSSKPKHGYAIMKDVWILSNDRIILSTGTLYGALKRLLEQG
jgi:DNA-binding PadR family transcriptional regulator